MPRYMTDPSITMRGMREPESAWEILSRIAQLRALNDDRRYNRIREEEAGLRVGELRRQLADEELMRGATSAAVRPGLQVPAGSAERGGFPNIGVDVPPSLDRLAMLRELEQRGGRHLVPQAQARFSEQDFTQKEQRLKLAKQVREASKAQMDEWKQSVDLAGRALRAVLEAEPETMGQVYASALRSLRESGSPALRGIAAEMPPEFTPDLIPTLQFYAQRTRDVEEVIAADEDERHNREMEKRPTAAQAEFADYYKAWLGARGIEKPNAKHELQARDDFRRSKRAPKAPPAHERRGEEDASVEQTAGDYLAEAKGDINRALDLLNADERDPDVSEDLRRLASRIRQRIRERARKTGKRDRLGDILSGPVDLNQRPNQ